MSRNNRKLAERFSRENVTREYLETYRILLERGFKTEEIEA
jgi:SOS response regulatory protein OraA/RecX